MYILLSFSFSNQVFAHCSLVGYALPDTFEILFEIAVAMLCNRTLKKRSGIYIPTFLLPISFPFPCPLTWQHFTDWGIWDTSVVGHTKTTLYVYDRT